MAKRKKQEEAPEAPKSVSPAREEAFAEAAEPSPAGEEPAVLTPQKADGGTLKIIAVAALFILALALAYYFLSLSDAFSPGASVDAETFKGIFSEADTVFIVMDVRGAQDDITRGNILQCGVDFAASSGMGGKSVTPMSFDEGGCVGPDGKHTAKDCFSMLKNGLTIYVEEGPGGAQYHTNGMIVTVGKEYRFGTCGIKRD